MRIFLSLFLFVALVSSAIALKANTLTAEAFPKGGIYDNPRVIALRSNDPNAKIMWTRNPDAPPDETFVYELPIPIHYTQEIWFFAFNDEMEITPFQKEKYVIRVNPDRYSHQVIVSEFSPKQDFVVIKNLGEKPVSLKNWKLESRHGNYVFDEREILPSRKTIKIPLVIGDVLDKVILRSPDQFIKDFFRYKGDFSEDEVLTRKQTERKIIEN